MPAATIACEGAVPTPLPLGTMGGRSPGFGTRSAGEPAAVVGVGAAGAALRCTVAVSV